MKLRRILVVLAVCLTAFVTTTTAAGADQHGGDHDHHHDHDKVTTCAGGTVAPGAYRSLVVTGFCTMAPGTFTVAGRLTIAAGGGLDATNCDTHLSVSDGVRVGAGALLGIGGSVIGTGCAADTNDVVHGGLDADNPLAVIMHGTSVDGGFSVHGGGGWDDCNRGVPGLGFPPFTDVEDSHITGGATMSGMTTCWMGFIRNEVRGGVHIDHNTMGDPDAIEIGLNTIRGNLSCHGNQLDPAIGGPGGVPTNSFDGSPPNPNTVTGHESGQCAGL